MIEWSDTDLMVRDAVRGFVDKEIRPHLDELEHGDLPPYDIIRKLYSSFGLDVAARESVERALARGASGSSSSGGGSGRGGQRSMMMLAICEISKVCLGIT